MRISDWSSDVCSSDLFGLTLSPEGRLAAARPSLIGAGGVERAFAATRSLFVQLALLAELCRVLGVRTGPIDAALEAGPAAALPGLDGAMDRLAAARAFVVSGRGLFQGLAEAASLTLMELGRVPVLSRSEEHTSELPSLMRISYAVFC